MKITGFYVGNPMRSKPVQVAKNSHRILAVAPVIIGNTATDDSFMEVVNAAFNIADYLCVGVFIFAGASWMFGNRTNAMEYLIGGSSGYLLIRNSVRLKNWLKELTPDVDSLV